MKKSAIKIIVIVFGLLLLSTVIYILIKGITNYSASIPNHTTYSNNLGNFKILNVYSTNSILVDDGQMQASSFGTGNSWIILDIEFENKNNSFTFGLGELTYQLAVISSGKINEKTNEVSIILRDENNNKNVTGITLGTIIDKSNKYWVKTNIEKFMTSSIKILSSYYVDYIPDNGHIFIHGTPENKVLITPNEIDSTGKLVFGNNSITNTNGKYYLGLNKLGNKSNNKIIFAISYLVDNKSDNYSLLINRKSIGRIPVPNVIEDQKYIRLYSGDKNVKSISSSDTCKAWENILKIEGC